MKYEICYLVGESKEATLADIKGGVEKIITQEGGVFYGIETMDKRKLAYKVEKEIRGFYVARRFEFPETEAGDSAQAENSLIQEITKKLNLYGEILRFLIIKAEQLPELKQRELPNKVEKGERRFDRSKGQSATPFRKAAAPKREEKVAEAKAETVNQEETPASVPEESKKESIDQKLDEILNI